MNISQSIFVIYPDIANKEFLVQDDGQGAYIAKWEYRKPQPTNEELEEAWLLAQKSMQLEQKKQECRDTILSRYSETDQANLYQDSLAILGSLLVEQREPTQDESIKLHNAKLAKEFRDEVLTEFRTNGINADFSKWKQE